MNFMEDCDLLFVIGTMLETGFSSNMVRKMCSKEVPIVEINPLPIIDYKSNYILKGNAEDILPKVIETFFLLVNYPYYDED